MAFLSTSEHRGPLSQLMGSQERGWSIMPSRKEHFRVTPGLLIAGLAVAGVAALAGYYLGRDMIRYIRIHNM